jgi:phosphate starvation-inducible PhoH-like protein
MAVNGDLTQIDLPPGQKSGLRDALEAIEGVDGIGSVRFSSKDVVRHHLVQRIVSAYDARDRKKSGRSAAPVAESNKGVDG